MPTLRHAGVSLLALLVAAGILSAQTSENAGTAAAEATSPNGQITLRLFAEDGAGNDLRYTVDFHGKPLFAASKLGLDLVGRPVLGKGMRKTGEQPESADDIYTLPVGKTRTVRDHYNGMRADFEDATGRKLSIEVRAFDDGVAFRYLVPKQPGIGQTRIAHELTQFSYATDASTYPLILDGYQSSWEDEYQLRNVSGLHKEWLIGLPYLSNEPGVGWVAITEADIEHYSGMYLRKAEGFSSRTVHADLSPHEDAAGNIDPSYAVETETPFASPWRVLMIADEPGKLIESNIALNLNPPSQIADTSWIKAGKSAWDWWSGDAAPSLSVKPGMSTEIMKHYIDFASASGFPYMLIDAGWEAKDPGATSTEPRLADITHVSPNIDMPDLLRYAKEKNVKLWLWAHWTSVDAHMDQAFPLFEKWGIAGVKIDFMNRDDQWMVEWYRKVVAAAAEHHLMIDYHGAFKPDGLRRTYPNLMTREGVMGKEYLKGTARVTPAHNATLPFTRMLAGPMDYTPGAFNNTNLEHFVPRRFMPMGLNTRAQELALYVIFESELEMVSDYPEAYAGQKEFDFIKRVPCTWDEVRSIGGMPMQWITLARRSGNDWYVGSLTDWVARDVKVPLSFLGDGKYVAEIYADAPDAAEEPTHTVLTKQTVDRTTVLDVHMVPGGGNAMWIHPAE
ncbi:MAG: glycoside hydrolase family 97 protein [Terracidiphilus sp.]